MKYKKIKKIVFVVLALGFLASSLYASEKLSREKINYIISKYQHVKCDKEYLFYPAKKAKRLLICFSGAGQKNGKCLYSQFSWYWQDDEKWTDTAYLFLKDDSVCWYLGNDKKDLINDFINIINYHIKVCNLTKDQVFTTGSSMGGYASILYATLLGLKAAIVVNPQVNKASNNGNRFGINNTESKWQDIDKIVALSQTVPNISLSYGHAPQDEAACNTLLDVLRKREATTIVRRHQSENHTIADLVFSKEFIERELTYFEDQKQFKESTEKRSIDGDKND